MDNLQHRVLLIDDEPDVLEFMGYNLTREGFEVHTAPNGERGIEIMKQQNPDLIVLDVMMPGMDGMETCAEIRKTPGFEDIFIILLTARAEDYSQLAGFEAGADDYVTKPVKPKILISRIRALLKRLKGRSSVSYGKNILTINELIIDREKYVVVKEGNEISLPRKEFELLVLLASRPNRVYTREEIFSAVWGPDIIVGDRTIDVHIRRIREKIGIDNIKTVKGVGYKYEESA